MPSCSCLLLFALLGLLVPIPAHAQEPGPTTWDWRTFTSDNSPLAPGRVFKLLEDSQARIWIGTDEGLSLYQAGAWKTFTSDNSLALGPVQQLLEDSYGRIWVGTSYYDSDVDRTTNSLNLYQAGAWQTFTSDNSPLAPGMVDELVEDSQGRMWVGTSDGVSLYQAGAWQTFTADNSPLAPGWVSVLIEDSQGRMWVGTSGGVSLYQVGAWQTFTSDNSPLAPGGVTKLLEDSQDRMWVGTSGGVSLCQAGAWQTFTAENSPLAPGGVTELREDSQGRIWVGTYDWEILTGGLSVYQAGAWQTYTSDNSLLAPGKVQSVLEDSGERIWAATYDWETGTGGISIYHEGAWQTFTAGNSPLAPGRVTELLEDSQGYIWVGTDGYNKGKYIGGISLYQAGTWRTFTASNSPLAPGMITALLEDSGGCIWVGTYDGETRTAGVSVYNAGAWRAFTSDSSLLAPGEVRCTLEDSRGRIWVGTYDWETRTGGVSIYQAGTWQTFTSNNSLLAPGGVRQVLEDSRGRIWVGTDGGVSVYETETWQRYTSDNYLLTPGGVWQIMEDSIGRIWMGTGGGVSVYRAGVWQAHTSEDSSLAPGVVQDMLEDLEGHIWIITNSGLSIRHAHDQPYAFLRYAGPAPGQATSLRTTSALTFTFSSPRSALEIGFSGVDAESDPDRLLFRCQLVGYDEEEVSCSSSVRYPALPPGTYTFRVRALDEDLVSSEPATATITLISTAPPTPTSTPAPAPTPYIVERERVVFGLPREALIPIIGGLGGLFVAMVFGVVIGREVRRARRLAAWRKGADPYVVGDVIEEPEQFYGREEALNELLHALEAGNHMALYGERRIGKTSLLHQLARRLRNLPQPAVHFLPVFVNLQMVPEPRFFYTLAEEVTKAARRELEAHGQNLPALWVNSADEYIRQREGYDSLNLANDLEAIVETLQNVTGHPPRIVLLLDEADKMNGYDPRTQEALRGLLMTPVGNNVKLVWSGQAMNREWHLESSPWYNLFKQELQMGGLEEESALRLIREPVREVFTYEDVAVQRILELTDYKPYPIQRLCSFCVRRLLAEKRLRVEADDVEAAWREMQAEDTRRAAEGATDLAYQSSRRAWAVAEKGTEYHTGKEGEA